MANKVSGCCFRKYQKYTFRNGQDFVKFHNVKALD
jgi:hypothetical protein